MLTEEELNAQLPLFMLGFNLIVIDNLFFIFITAVLQYVVGRPEPAYEIGLGKSQKFF